MSLWTVQQHEWLRALGHPVLLLAGDPALAATPPVAVVPEPPRPQPAAGPDVRGEPLAPRRGPLAASVPAIRPHVVDTVADPIASELPKADAAAKKAALAAARGARRGPVPTPLPLPDDDPLVQAILRASGLDADAFATAARRWHVDLARLRAQPLSKRTLWLQIRDKGRKPAR